MTYQRTPKNPLLAISGFFSGPFNFRKKLKGGAPWFVITLFS